MSDEKKPLPGNPAARGAPGTNASAQAMGQAAAGPPRPPVPPPKIPGLPQIPVTNPSLPTSTPGKTGPAPYPGNPALPQIPATNPGLPTTSPTPAAPGAGGPPRPPGPIIEYAMPSQKKSWLPSPAFIRNLGCMMKVCVGLTVVLGMGYFALVAMNPKARKWATQGAKDGSGGPTPFKAMNQILAIPAQAMGKTDDVVKANNARVGQLDGLVAEEEGKAQGGKSGRNRAPVVDPFAAPTTASAGKGAIDPSGGEGSGGQGVSAAALLALHEKLATTSAQPGPGETPPPPVATPPTEPVAPAQVQLAGGIIIASASPADGPVVRASFFYWVVNQNISGVFQSPPHRIMLDKRLTYEGTEVNHALGITFDQLDPVNKLIIFKDQTGALVTRSY